jgi:hypothetical protein
MRSSVALTLQNLGKANTLFGAATRMYSTRARVHSLSSLSESEEKFRIAFDPVMEEFRAHRAMNHPFFDFLREQARTGFNARQFEIYRDNFFYRTELTIPSVARAIEKAALEGDMQAVAETIRNIFDEGGYGDPSKVHSKLLLDSHNQHGQRIFGITPLAELKDARRSKLLIPEVQDYRRSKQAVFNRSYPYIAGNTLAHELAADGMLVNFREVFFDIYRGYYEEAVYNKLIGFYTAHRDDTVVGGDVEAEHGRMAQAAAERACRENVKNIQKMREGGLEFLDRQAALWDGMQRAIEQAKDQGVPIPPKIEHLPSQSTSPVIVGKLQNSGREIY